MVQKEDIFAGGLEAEASAMARMAAGYISSGAPLFRPERSALLVLDMQDYFLDSGSHAFVPGGRHIISRIVELVGAFIGRELPVIFTRHVNRPGLSGMMGRWWSETIEEDDPLSRITAGLVPDGALVVEKEQYDAFFETPLMDILSARGVERLVMTGLMTHLCVETTARSAFVRGFEVFVPADAVATYNRELQAGSLRALAHGFAVPVLSGEIAGAVEDGR